MKSNFFKIVIFSIFFIFANISLYANEIDSLQTFEDVQRFLKKKITKKHNDWDFSQKPGNDSSYLGKKEFIKLDLDDNGLTDILVNDRPIFAITDNGNDYNVHYFGEGIFDHNTYTLKTIVYKESIPLLIFDKKSRSEFRTDTLIFKFGGVIEYNSKPDNFKIEEIDLKPVRALEPAQYLKSQLKMTEQLPMMQLNITM